jgi:hypothetical protein
MVAFETANVSMNLTDSTGAKRRVTKAIRPVIRMKGDSSTRIPWSPSE